MGHCHWGQRAEQGGVEAGKDVYEDGGVYSGSPGRKGSLCAEGPL